MSQDPNSKLPFETLGEYLRRQREMWSSTRQGVIPLVYIILIISILFAIGVFLVNGGWNLITHPIPNSIPLLQPKTSPGGTQATQIPHLHKGDCSDPNSDNGTIIQTVNVGEIFVVGVKDSTQEETTTPYSSNDAVATYLNDHPDFRQNRQWNKGPHLIVWSMTTERAIFLIVYEGPSPLCKVVKFVNFQIKDYQGSGKDQVNDPNPYITRDGDYCDFVNPKVCG